jgi:hypothetical protein
MYILNMVSHVGASSEAAHATIGEGVADENCPHVEGRRQKEGEDVMNQRHQMKPTVYEATV